MTLEGPCECLEGQGPVLWAKICSPWGVELALRAGNRPGAASPSHPKETLGGQ